MDALVRISNASSFFGAAKPLRVGRPVPVNPGQASASLGRVRSRKDTKARALAVAIRPVG